MAQPKNEEQVAVGKNGNVEAEQPNKNKRPCYTAAQLTAIWKKATGETEDAPAEFTPEGHPVVKLGYRNIMKDIELVKTWGLKQEGARDTIARIKVSTGLDDFLERKKGSGPPKKVRTVEKVAEVKALIDQNNRLSYGEIAKVANINKNAVKQICTKDLQLKNVTQVKNQRIKTANKTKRMTACSDWLSKMDDGWQFDPRSVYWTDEKIFRIGEVGGGSKNYRVLISNDKRKYEMNAEELQRTDGAWMGGHQYMCSSECATTEWADHTCCQRGK